MLILWSKQNWNLKLHHDRRSRIWSIVQKWIYAQEWSLKVNMFLNIKTNLDSPWVYSSTHSPARFKAAKMAATGFYFRLPCGHFRCHTRIKDHRFVLQWALSYCPSTKCTMGNKFVPTRSLIKRSDFFHTEKKFVVWLSSLYWETHFKKVF